MVSIWRALVVAGSLLVVSSTTGGGSRLEVAGRVDHGRYPSSGDLVVPVSIRDGAGVSTCLGQCAETRASPLGASADEPPAGDDADEPPAGDDAPAAEGVSEEDMAALVAEGETLYLSRARPTPCAECHGEQGEGTRAPTLIGSRIVGDGERFVRRLLFGGQLMPAFATLTDREIAAVTTYVRNSWGNEFGPVTEEEVSRLR